MADPLDLGHGKNAFKQFEKLCLKLFCIGFDPLLFTSTGTYSLMFFFVFLTLPINEILFRKET